MAEEIIDLRDRIEKMRIQIENEATEQISVDIPLEVHKKIKNSNISLSMENKNNFPNQNFEVKNDSENSHNIDKNGNNFFARNESLIKYGAYGAAGVAVFVGVGLFTGGLGWMALAAGVGGVGA